MVLFYGNVKIELRVCIVQYSKKSTRKMFKMNQLKLATFCVIALVLGLIMVTPADAAYLEFDLPSRSCPFYLPGPMAGGNRDRGTMWCVIPVRAVREPGDEGAITMQPGRLWSPGTSAQPIDAINMRWIDDAGALHQGYLNNQYLVAPGPDLTSSDEDPNPTGYFFFRMPHAAFMGDPTTMFPNEALEVILSFPGSSQGCTLRTTPNQNESRSMIYLPTISVMYNRTAPINGWMTLGVEVLTADMAQTDFTALLINENPDLGTFEGETGGVATIEGLFQSHPDHDLSNAVFPPDVTADNFDEFPIYANSFYQFTITPTGKANPNETIPYTINRYTIGDGNPNLQPLIMNPGSCIRFVERYIAFLPPSTHSVVEGQSLSAPFVVSQTSPFTTPKTLYFTASAGVFNQDYIGINFAGTDYVRNVKNSTGGVPMSQGQTSGMLTLRTLANGTYDLPGTRQVIVDGAFAYDRDATTAPEEIPFGYIEDDDASIRSLTVNLTENGVWPYISFKETRVVVLPNAPTVNVDVSANISNTETMTAVLRANRVGSYPYRKAIAIDPGALVPNPLPTLTFSNPNGYTQYVTFKIAEHEKCNVGSKNFCTYEIRGLPSELKITANSYANYPGKTISIAIQNSAPKNTPIYIPVTYAPHGATGAINGIHYAGPYGVTIPAYKKVAYLTIQLSEMYVSDFPEFDVFFGTPISSTNDVTWASNPVVRCGIYNSLVPPKEGILLPAKKISVPPQKINIYSAAFIQGGLLGDIALSTTNKNKKYTLQMSLDQINWDDHLTMTNVGSTPREFFFRVLTNKGYNYTKNANLSIKFTSGSYSKTLRVVVADNRPTATFVAPAFVYDPTATYTIDPLTLSKNAEVMTSTADIQAVYPTITPTPYTAFNLTDSITSAPTINEPATGDLTFQVAPLPVALGDSDIGTFQTYYGVQNGYEDGVSANIALVTIGGPGTRTYPNALVEIPYYSGASYYANYYNIFATNADSSKLLKKVSLKAKTNRTTNVTTLELKNMPRLYQLKSYNAATNAGLFSFDPSIITTNYNPVAIEIWRKAGAARTKIATKLLMPPGPYDAAANTIFQNFNSWSYLLNDINLPVPLPLEGSDLLLHPGSIVSVTGNFFGLKPTFWIENTTYGASKTRRFSCKLLSLSQPGPDFMSTAIVQLPHGMTGNWQYDNLASTNAEGLNAFCMNSGVGIVGGCILLKQFLSTTNTLPIFNAAGLAVTTDLDQIDIPLSLEKLPESNSIPEGFRGTFVFSDANGDPLSFTISSVVNNDAYTGASNFPPGDKKFGIDGAKIVKNASGGYSLRFKRNPEVPSGKILSVQVTIKYFESNADYVTESQLATITITFTK